jgi:predicted secreted protein
MLLNLDFIMNGKQEGLIIDTVNWLCFTYNLDRVESSLLKRLQQSVKQKVKTEGADQKILSRRLSSPKKTSNYHDPTRPTMSLWVCATGPENCLEVMRENSPVINLVSATKTDETVRILRRIYKTIRMSELTSHADKTVFNVKRNDTFALWVTGCFSCGFDWILQHDKDEFEMISEEPVCVIDPEPGNSCVKKFLFHALKSGNYEISGFLKRSWDFDRGEPHVWKVHVT